MIDLRYDVGIVQAFFNSNGVFGAEPKVAEGSFRVSTRFLFYFDLADKR